MIHSIQKFSYLFLIGVGLLSSCSNDQSSMESKDLAEEHNEDKFNTKAGEKDAQFVVDMVSGTYYEIRLASFGEQKSATAEVRSMANKMVNDHTTMLNNLKSIATAKSISVPAEDSVEVAKAIKDLNDGKMENFDKEWTNKMVDKHKASISKLEGGLNDVTDPEIKSWIETSLPTVRSHFDMLNKLHDAMK